MRVRLIKKLAEVIDGVDLAGHAVGDVLDLDPHEATLLIAEGWALPDGSAPRRDHRRQQQDRRFHETLT